MCSMRGRQIRSGHVPARGAGKKAEACGLALSPPRSDSCQEAADRSAGPSSHRFQSLQWASNLFPDCEVGAVPILGTPYRIACVIDKRLDGADDIYFEGGDHRTLVHVSGEEFGRMIYGMPQGRISA